MKLKRKLIALALYLTPMVALADKIKKDQVDDTTIITANIEIVDVLVKVINWVLSFSAALAVLFIIIGGVRYITSSGNAEALEGAKKTLL